MTQKAELPVTQPAPRKATRPSPPATSGAPMSPRKAELVALARKLFAEQGYSATSMRDLAEVSGLLPGSLYTHFKSKADLARQIVMEFFDDLIPEQQAAHDATGSGAQRFALMIDKVYQVCARHHEAVRTLHYDWQVLSALDEMADMLEATNKTMDLWYDTAAGAIADGSFQPDIDPEYLVRISNVVILSMFDPGRFQMRPAPRSAIPQVDVLKRCLLIGVTTAAGAKQVRRSLDGPTKHIRKTSTRPRPDHSTSPHRK